MNRESYRLDFIGEVELGQKKLDHSEFDTFKDFYKGNWKKFIDYNIKDVELVDRLEDKMKLIELVITMAFDAKVNFIDPIFFKSVCGTRLSTTISRRETLSFHLRTGLRRMTSSVEYVKEPKPGVYDYVVSFDLNSLYPHLMMQYNISPETLMDEKHPSLHGGQDSG